MDISFLLGGSVVAVLLVQLIKTAYGKVEGRFGSLITQLIVLAASFIVAGAGMAFRLLPPQIIQVTTEITVGAIAIYEILYKAIFVQALQNKQ